ncbi:MAG: methyltransferase domain-containing protein, partial [Planctomycetes bacterium]|nr:methyltransferase domain-containing protein [Planctomycetota bacterium]
RERLAQDEIEASLVGPSAPQALRLDEGRWRFRHTDAWREGTFLVQDLTAQRVAPLLAPQPGERILDLCAAPGGKTTHLAELSGDKAQIVACDLKMNRLRKIEQNLERLGLSSVETRRHDARYAAQDFAEEPPFDALLLDAPCSNTGVLRRRSEARWRFDVSSQRRLRKIQDELLRAALPLVRGGGRLVYSLCSIEVDEGRDAIAALRAEHPGLELEHEELWFPTPGGGDGGYAALLRVP